MDCKQVEERLREIVAVLGALFMLSVAVFATYVMFITGGILVLLVFILLTVLVTIISLWVEGQFSFCRKEKKND